MRSVAIYHVLVSIGFARHWISEMSSISRSCKRAFLTHGTCDNDAISASLFSCFTGYESVHHCCLVLGVLVS